MKTGIKVKNFKHINEEYINGVIVKSFYNYNFYVDSNFRNIILEICDDNSQYDYYRSAITNNQLVDKNSFLGTYFGKSIFDKNFKDIDVNGYAIVDDSIF